MTLSDNYLPTKDLGNGITTVFSFTWNAVSSSYVKVYFENVTTGVQVLQTTGFTIALGAASGGTVTFTTPPPSTEYVIIAREVPASNLVPYRTATGFPSKTVETNFDSFMAVIQQLQDANNRSVKTALGSSTQYIIPEPDSGKVLSNDGTNLIWSTLTTTTYPGDISFGNDADKAVAPTVGDLYFAVDTELSYYCYSAGVWSTLSSPLTTKGDISTYSTEKARLPVGANDQVLTADSSQDTGLKWAVPSSTPSSIASFSVYPTSNQTNIAVGSQVTVVFGSERFDTGGDFASNTFTAPQDGKYQLNVSIVMEAMDSAASLYQLFVVTSNKTYEVRFDPSVWSKDGIGYLNFSVVADMDINDTAVVTVEQTGGAQQTDIMALSSFSGSLI